MAGNVYDSIRKDYAQDGAMKLAASATVGSPSCNNFDFGLFV
jgi:hypothetical protein